jgi:dGTPase
MLRTRAVLERIERSRLAPYAALSAGAAREHREKPPAYRTQIERDWNRILHSRAFRRLEYKTQVLPFGVGSDFVRNRLTHTLEAMQIGIGIARALGLNEDLVMAIVMAHDLGHTPFGHKGEEALAACAGGFNHNVHSLRIVRELEHRYVDFPGLNLTILTLEGIEKHDTDYDRPEGYRYFPGVRPSLEAQVANLADTIAYRAHDIEDALESGIVAPRRFERVPFWRQAMRGVTRAERTGVWYAQVSRSAIALMIDDAIRATAATIRRRRVRTLQDVRRCAVPLAGFSPAMSRAQQGLADFLMDEFYTSPQVVRACTKGVHVIQSLFRVYAEDPRMLPRKVQRELRAAPKDGIPRIIADYIAGMTDRFAMAEYANLCEGGKEMGFDPTVWKSLES